MEEKGNESRKKAAAAAMMLWLGMGLGLTGCGREDAGKELSDARQTQNPAAGDATESLNGDLEVSAGAGVNGSLETSAGVGDATESPEGDMEVPSGAGNGAEGMGRPLDGAEDDTEDTKVILDGAEYDIRWTKVILDGVEYDIADKADLVNAISGIQEVGGYWIVTGHINPNRSWYGFYNRESGRWEKEIFGEYIAWDDSAGTAAAGFTLDSIIYTVDSGGFDCDGNLIGRVELDSEEFEYICGLSRKDSQAEIQIQNAEVERRTITMDLP